MIRRCNNLFKCQRCDEWLPMTNQYCKTCNVQYPLCDYYEDRHLTAQEFQKYAIKYNLISVSIYGWCSKYGEAIKNLVSKDKFFNTTIICEEKYAHDKEI
jgi:hypothetical protein